MKTTIGYSKTLFLTVASMLCFAGNAQKRNIPLTQLPANAQSFIKTNFPNQATTYIIEDKDIVETEYKVIFSSGVEVEFNGKGNWEEIEANKTILPNTIYPKAIADYIAKNYKGHTVDKFEKKHGGFNLEFTNDLELEFDASGKFLRIDN
jgi:hypothetical protein